LLAIPCALGVGWIGIALFLKATCMNGKPVNTYFEILASVEPPWPLMGVIALTILIPMAIRRFHRESVLGFVWWVSFSLGLYIAPQTTKHTWYIADVGRSLLFVLSMVGFIDFLRAQQTSGGTLPPGVLFYFNNMR